MAKEIEELNHTLNLRKQYSFLGDEEGTFTGRELNLLANCETYVTSISGPAGLPGHNLMIIIVKLINVIRKLKEVEN